MELRKIDAGPLGEVGEFPTPLPRVTKRDAICIYLEKKLGNVKTIATGIENHFTILTVYRKFFICECCAGQGRIKESDLHAIKSQTDKLVANK